MNVKLILKLAFLVLALPAAFIGCGQQQESTVRSDEVTVASKEKIVTAAYCIQDYASEYTCDYPTICAAYAGTIYSEGCTYYPSVTDYYFILSDGSDVNYAKVHSTNGELYGAIAANARVAISYTRAKKGDSCDVRTITSPTSLEKISVYTYDCTFGVVEEAESAELVTAGISSLAAEVDLSQQQAAQNAIALEAEKVEAGIE